MKIVLLLRATHKDPSCAETLDWLGPCDEAALRTALSLTAAGGELVAVTAGPPVDDVCLDLALKAGVPRAVRIWDTCLEDTDLRTLCAMLAAGIYRIGFDLIIAGHRSADWGSAAVGPALAHFLGIAHVSSVIGARPEGSEGAASTSLLRVEHLSDEEILSLQVPLPALITVREGPARVLEERTALPAIEVMDMEDTTLRFARVSDLPDAGVRPCPARTPARLSGAAALLLELKNSGLLR